MEPFRIYGKTEAGTAALSARGALSSPARQLLILIDGQRTIGELHGIFGADALGKMLPQLEIQGLVRFLRDDGPGPTLTMPPESAAEASDTGGASTATAATAANPGAGRNGAAVFLLALGVLGASAAIWWFLGRPQAPVQATVADNAAPAAAEVPAAPAPPPANAAPNERPPLHSEPRPEPRAESRVDSRADARVETRPQSAADSRATTVVTKPAAAPLAVAGTPAPRTATNPAAVNPAAIVPPPVATAPPATAAPSPTPPAAGSTSAAAAAPRSAAPTAPAPPTPVAPPPAPSLTTAPAGASGTGAAAGNSPATAASPNVTAATTATAAAASSPSAAPVLHARERTMPVLSRRAKRAGIDTGDLVVRLHVSARGTVDSIDVLKANPPQVYDAEVQAILQKWTFDPPGVATVTTVEFAFKP